MQMPSSLVEHSLHSCLKRIGACQIDKRCLGSGSFQNDTLMQVLLLQTETIHLRTVLTRMRAEAMTYQQDIKKLQVMQTCSTPESSHPLGHLILASLHVIALSSVMQRKLLLFEKSAECVVFGSLIS